MVIALILEAGHFTARTIHARNAAKRQKELARQVEDALTRSSALVARRPDVTIPELVVEEREEPRRAGPDVEPALAAPQADVGEPGPPPRPTYFPLTEPQRRLLQDLALGRSTLPGGDRLGTEVMLEWLATLGFVRRGEGAEYAITPLGRQVLEAAPQR